MILLDPKSVFFVLGGSGDVATDATGTAAGRGFKGTGSRAIFGTAAVVLLTSPVKPGAGLLGFGVSEEA